MCTFRLTYVLSLFSSISGTFFFFSHKDIKWVKEIFWKSDGVQFDMEKEYGFRFMIHDRDWIAGRTIRANITDSLEKSRRVIFILSRYLIIETRVHWQFTSHYQDWQCSSLK